MTLGLLELDFVRLAGPACRLVLGLVYDSLFLNDYLHWFCPYFLGAFSKNRSELFINFASHPNSKNRAGFVLFLLLLLATPIQQIVTSASFLLATPIQQIVPFSLLLLATPIKQSFRLHYFPSA